jgi:uncharacterized radical SAM superfamily protein
MKRFHKDSRKIENEVFILYILHVYLADTNALQALRGSNIGVVIMDVGN